MNEKAVNQRSGRFHAFLYPLIVVCTLIGIELASFGYLWGLAVFAGEKAGTAASSLMRLHPWMNTAIPFGFYDPIVFQRYEPGSKTGNVGINAHGFIHNGHSDPLLNSFPEKPPSVRRIILLGGSSMAGNALRSDNTQTISAHLERILNADPKKGERFQVLNFGVSGDFSSIEMTRFMTEVIHIEPDIVVTLDGWNDAIAAAFEHKRMKLAHPLINWGNLAYQYYDRMLRLGTQTAPPPVLFTYVYLTLKQLGLLTPQKPDRASAYKANSITGLSNHLIKKNKGMSFLLGANNSVIAAYCAVHEIGYIGYLQPFAGYRRFIVEQEEAMLIQRHALLSKVHGPEWARTPYKTATDKVYARYHQDFEKLRARFRDTNHVSFIDISDLFSETNQTVYLDQIHYNDLGNALIAEKFASDIQAMLKWSPFIGKKSTQ